MSTKKGPETSAEVLRALSDFLSGPEPDFSRPGPEQVKRYLKKNDLDTSHLLKKVTGELSRARGQIELAEAQRKRGGALERLGALAGEKLRATREELLAQIEALAGPEQAAVYYRKLEDASDEDLASLLEDLGRLKSLGSKGEDAEE